MATTTTTTAPATTYRVWARVRPEPVQGAHQPRWFLQGGPVEGWSIEDAARQAATLQSLHKNMEFALLPLEGSSPCTMADLARLAGLTA